ncbi:MAG: glycoside hydrolase family 92 protein [Prevotella sp.]|nr:glycoside hydrolase family 92 protein [Prevotella sp.]
MRKSFLMILLMACALLAQAQTRQQMGGVYYAYPAPQKPVSMKAPEGYTAFYVSHYGRHGSRWLPSDSRYTWVNHHFDDETNLTPLGKKVKGWLTQVWENAKGNGGKLTKLGEKQHRGIADRMAHNFPQIFAKGNHVQARSSVVDRCAKSMMAFTDELRQLQPSLDMDVKTDSADMAWIAYTSPEVKALENRTHIVAKVSPDRFLHQLFKDITKVDDPIKLMSEIHTIASSIQDVGLNFKSYPRQIEVGLYGLFTDEEFKAFYDANNLRMTICNGVYPTNERIPARSAISLWENVEAEADKALASDRPSATLRFGHDTSLYRLYSLMNMFFARPDACCDTDAKMASYKKESDAMDVVVPMAANLQLVFYKKKQWDRAYPESNVLVRILCNERNVGELNLNAYIYNDDIEDMAGNYYTWASLKNYMHEYIHYLEHVRQLNAINTMVGTAQANTKTAGKFGKGSEEHGQTLPAVLVPNGQNFWTPQTQDTEKKCIAPYYYKDTELQGFRNSHWIVGGCTQDYGSFTIATLGGKLRLQPEERATRFSHEDEVSHPHYYAVHLRDEHLKTEMTALSHSAIFRITPDQDEEVHIVINPNSDEGEGYIEIDTLHHIIYGYNPVHRIYQGWGEPAGFSGHFVLDYSGELNFDVPSSDISNPRYGETPCGFDDFGVFSKEEKTPQGLSVKGSRSGAWLTFKGKAGKPIEIRAASSFTSKKNACDNLVGETAGGFDFDDFILNAETIWCDRLHAIDVESKDVAKVNQFYGALYRASFLPHEMSDVYGSYPTFSTGKVEILDSSDSSALDDSADIADVLYVDTACVDSISTIPTIYGDFSMWDIYRAELPLYNIITPTLSGDMMQSLVNMYKEGGWMPIFPCWNSYTAAMIGDHSGVALADAYVKGIRSFDAKTAYEGMRKNAFESPKTFEEYKNGMGRRALNSYLKYGYIPMEDSVKEAFHTNEQTSRTLEYAFDDFAVAQLAKALAESCSVEAKDGPYTRQSLKADYAELMRRSENWRNVINPKTGWADGRHQNGKWEGNTDLVHRKSYITEGATCHYTWYVPQNIQGLFNVINKSVDKSAKRLNRNAQGIFQSDTMSAVVSRLDKMFDEGLYWHGNEPCHQVAYLYDAAGAPWKTQQRIHHILNTEYNDTPGGLSGNDDAGQMSAWYVFSAIGFYPVCPSTPYYYIGTPSFDKVTFNLENGKKFEIQAHGVGDKAFYIQKTLLNGKPMSGYQLSHDDILKGGNLEFWMGERPANESK